MNAHWTSLCKQSSCFELLSNILNRLIDFVCCKVGSQIVTFLWEKKKQTKNTFDWTTNCNKNWLTFAPRRNVVVLIYIVELCWSFTDAVIKLKINENQLRIYATHYKCLFSSVQAEQRNTQTHPYARNNSTWRLNWSWQFECFMWVDLNHTDGALIIQW